MELYSAQMLHLLVKCQYEGVDDPFEYTNSVMMPLSKPENGKTILSNLIKKLSG